MSEAAKTMDEAEPMFPTTLRRWTILIRCNESGELRSHDFHHGQFPSEEDKAREALSKVDPQGLPVLKGSASLRELLAARGFSVVWIQEATQDASTQAAPASASTQTHKSERPQG